MNHHHDYDEVDAPAVRKPRNKNLFQRELDAKMKDLRSRGQAADITPSEGSDEEEVLNARYKKSLSPAARQRPGSAKRRPERTMNLGDTLRPRDVDSMFGSHRQRDDSLDREVASFDNKGMPRIGGRTPSPRESLLSRKTPTGKKTPTEQHEMSKEELIFGSKTLKHDEGRQGLPESVGKKWTPPTFQKTTPMEPDAGHRTPSPASRGRQTPSSLLDPISESSPRTPRDPYSNSMTPRGDLRTRPHLKRQSSIGSDKSPRPLSIETSPRGSDHPSPKPRGKGNQAEVIKGRKTPPIGRKTPPVDLFGSQRKVSMDDEVDSTMKSHFRNKESDTDRTTSRFRGRKTPETLSGRKTPPGKVLSGRRTPETVNGRKTPMGRKTPTGRKTPVEKEEPEKKPEKKSVLDFLEDDPVAKPQPKPQARGRRKSKSDVAGDSDEMMTTGYLRSSRTPPLRRKSDDRGYDDKYEERRDSRGYDDSRERRDGKGYGDGRDYGDGMDRRRFDTDGDRFDGRHYESDRRHDPGSDRLDGRRYDPGSDRLDGREYNSGRDKRGYEDIIGQAQEGDRMDSRRYDRRRDDSLDKSSLCEELEREPGSRNRPTKDGKQSPAYESDKKKHMTSATKALENAISEVAQVQDKTERDKKLPKHGDTAKHKPKPRYPTMPGEATQKRDVNYDDANSIREAIYQQWYEERMEKAKKELAKKKKEEKEEEEKKKKALEDKLMEAKLSYNGWVDKKKDTLSKARRKKIEEEKKKKEADMEKEKKLREAAVAFNMWKEKADELIVEKTRKQRREMDQTKTKEVDKKYMRTQDSESAFRGWKTKKDVILEKRAKEEKTKKKHQIRKEEDQKITKDEEAIERYQEWMRNKERADRMNHQRTMRLEDEFRPPWSPANKTIPFGH